MNLGPTELLIILGIVLLLFGSAKLPQLARSLGRSARILKAETKGLHDDDGDPAADQPQQQAAAAQPANDDARERAARLREEAARLERDAAMSDGAQRRQGALPAGDAIEGVPVDPDQIRKSR